VVILHHPADRSGPSGIGRYSRSLAGALRAEGEEVVEWVLRPFELRLGGKGIGGLAARRAQLAVPRLTGGHVVHSTHAYAAHRQASVATVHDLFPEKYRTELGRTPVEHDLAQAGFRRLAARKAQFLTTTRAVKGDLLHFHPEVADEDVHVTGLGIDPTFTPPAVDAPLHPAYDPEAFNVLVVADLNPRKRVDWLLAAASQWPKGDLRLVQAGARTVHRPAWAEQAAREAPLAERLLEAGTLVRIPGAGENELVRLYQGADLLVMASLDEGFGLPAAEAMACGTPVLAMDRPVFREVLGPLAAYYEGPEDLPEALRRHPRRPGRTERARRAVEVRDRHDWRLVARKTMDAYEAARARRTSASSSSSSER
jgi:glycosyltransferase involved in cell wall biosynthesis